MKTIIKNFRISYIHGITFLDFKPATALPAYHNFFVMAKSAPEYDLYRGKRYWRLPWPKTRRGHQKFWERYLDVSLDNLEKSERALNFLVPFRIRLARISADWLKPGRAYMYGYQYPHRAVVVINISAENNEGYTPDELIDHAVKIRTNGLYRVEWLNNRAESQLTLKNLAYEALDRLLSLLQNDSQLRKDDPDPFTIATVIKGDFDPDEFTKNLITNGPIHQMLFTLCTGQKRRKLPDDDCKHRQIKKLGSDALPSDILYGRYRARAGWFPQRFSQSDKKFPLRCYHNNLTFASMQTDSLLAAVRLADEKLQQNLSIAGLAKIAKPAAALLGPLYGPSPKKIYQSYSVREQIRHELRAVNNVRRNILHNPILLLDD